MVSNGLQKIRVRNPRMELGGRACEGKQEDKDFPDRSGFLADLYLQQPF